MEHEIDLNCIQLVSSKEQNSKLIEQVVERPIVDTPNLPKNEGALSIGITDWLIIGSCTFNMINHSLKFWRIWRIWRIWRRRRRSRRRRNI